MKIQASHLRRSCYHYFASDSLKWYHSKQVLKMWERFFKGWGFLCHELNIKGLMTLDANLNNYLTLEQLNRDNQYFCTSCNARVDATIYSIGSQHVPLSWRYKSYMLMTLNGLAYGYKKWVLHRDMKPKYLQIKENGLLKLADFGLARLFGSPNGRFAHQVLPECSIKTPELLFGNRHYRAGVDVSAAEIYEILRQRSG